MLSKGSTEKQYILTKRGDNLPPDIISDEMFKFIKNYVLQPGKLLSLVNAVGAGEYYGPNSRGDYFPEDQLKNEGTDYGYKTFEYFAKPYYRHEVYPGGELGRVLRAFYNDKIHRVFVINEIDIDKYRRITGADPYDDSISVSMGCTVQAEICSICGYVNTRSLATRCIHMKNMMNHILSDGRKVYAINIKPKFKDITYTYIPADSTCTVLMKVGSETTPIRQSVVSAIRSVPLYWPDVSPLLRKYGSKAVSYLTTKGTIFSPSEFDLIAKMEIENSIFKKAEENEYTQRLYPDLVDAAYKRTIFLPYVLNQVQRGIIYKQADNSGISQGYLEYRLRLLDYPHMEPPAAPSLRSYERKGAPELLLKLAFGTTFL